MWVPKKQIIIIQHLETVIKSRIPGLQSLINKTIAELEAELSRLGKPIATDTGVRIKIVYFLFSFDSFEAIFSAATD